MSTSWLECLLCPINRGPAVSFQKRRWFPAAEAVVNRVCSVSPGADHIRKYWSRYYQGSQGVIFVLDSASSEGELETARNELHSALQHPQLCTLPFLILANHQDKPAARSAQEVCRAGAGWLGLSRGRTLGPDARHRGTRGTPPPT